MDTVQKDKIAVMRGQGASYAEIATAMGISVNTVKSFWRRNSTVKAAAPLREKADICKKCGAVLIHLPKHKAKQFCSDKCRMAWWNAHPELLRHKKVNNGTCRQCGAEVVSYGSRERKFCSIECYRKYRSVTAGGAYEK